MWQALADFHFLRPAWLLALAPCALLAWWLHRRRQLPALWSELIDPALLGVLLLPAGGRRGNALPWLLFGGWAALVVALAGPAWERLPQPVHRSGDALVIALYLGDSMRAADLKPSRYERARFKLEDLLARRGDGQTALIVYAGDAHIVTPLSDDARTLAAMLPALAPEIMPAAGNDLPGAVALAASLARGAGLERARLLVLSDRFEAAQHAAVAEALARGGLRLSLLAVGTAAGAPITLPGGGFLRDRSGSIVVPALDLETMREGVAAAGGRFATLTLDDSDITQLLPPPLATDIRDEPGATRSFDQWQDRAPWLALALLPLAALAFRRGWLLGLLLVAVLLPPQRADALEWQDLWQRPDQQGARALAEGEAARAAGLFRSPDWRGTAQYQAGDYAGAAETWAAGDSAAAHYNRGNALARAGRLDEALAAYDAALARDPAMTDATANRALVEQLQQQREQQAAQESQGQQSQDGAQSPQGGAQQQSPGQQPDGAGEGSEDNGPGEQAQRGGGRDRESRDAGQDGGGQTDGSPDAAQDGGGHKGNEPETAQQTPGAGAAEAREPAGRQPADAAGTEAGAVGGEAADGAPGEQEQAVEQWLRQVPDAPGELLRRKFEYEHRARRARSGDEL